MSKFSASPRSRKLLLGALLALVAGALGVPSAANAVDNGSLGIRPAHESDFFHLHALAGSTLENTAIVSNHTNRPVTLLDYPVDAHNSATGTFAMAARTDPRKEVGAWVQLDADAITIPAGTERPLPFRLHVPAGTAPGDYAGALVIQSPPVVSKTSVHNGTAVRLNIVQRQGLRIYLHVDGTAIKALTTGPLHATPTGGGGVDFTLRIHNTGNITLHPAAELTLASRIGVNTNLRFMSVESILPGDGLTLRAHLDHPAPIQIGTATATVRSEAGTRTLTADFTALPWTGIAEALAALLLAAMTLRMAARARKRRRSEKRRATPRVPGPSHAAPPISHARHRAELTT